MLIQWYAMLAQNYDSVNCDLESLEAMAKGFSQQGILLTFLQQTFR